MIEGAKAARGITVVIDVFRAFSVEAHFLNEGAKAIIPVGDVDVAYKLKEKNPDMILAGEREGKILPGFDVGNSPSELVKLECAGKTVVHTTSAGTQGIANAINADVILGGCLLNAKATAEYIRNSGYEDVSLVCMGLGALRETEEDNLCANYIKSILEGTEIDMEKEIASLRNTSGAKFFDKAQQSVFPEPDFHMCTELDKFDFVTAGDILSDSHHGGGFVDAVVVNFGTVHSHLLGLEHQVHQRRVVASKFKKLVVYVGFDKAAGIHGIGRRRSAIGSHILGTRYGDRLVTSLGLKPCGAVTGNLGGSSCQSYFFHFF